MRPTEGRCVVKAGGHGYVAMKVRYRNVDESPNVVASVTAADGSQHMANGADEQDACEHLACLLAEELDSAWGRGREGRIR